VLGEVNVGAATACIATPISLLLDSVVNYPVSISNVATIHGHPSLFTDQEWDYGNPRVIAGQENSTTVWYFPAIS